MAVTPTLYIDTAGDVYYVDGADASVANAVLVEIDGEPWAVTVDELKPETTRFELQRSVDGGTTWEPVTETTTGTSLTDYEGLSSGDTYYRLAAYTSAGASSETTIIIHSDSAAAWVGKGENYGQTAALRHALKLTPTVGLTHQSTYHFSGKVLPDEISGDAVDRKISVTGTLLAPRLELESHTANDFDALASTPGTVLYRDPEGRRWYGALTAMSTPQGTSGVGSVSYSVQETNKPTDSEVDYGGY